MLYFIVFGPESGKRDLKDIKVKIKVFRQKERTGLDKHFLKNLKRLSLLMTKISALELVYIMCF